MQPGKRISTSDAARNFSTSDTRSALRNIACTPPIASTKPTRAQHRSRRRFSSPTASEPRESAGPRCRCPRTDAGGGPASPRRRRSPGRHARSRRGARIRRPATTRSHHGTGFSRTHPSFLSTPRAAGMATVSQRSSRSGAIWVLRAHAAHARPSRPGPGRPISPPGWLPDGRGPGPSTAGVYSHVPMPPLLKSPRSPADFRRIRRNR